MTKKEGMKPSREESSRGEERRGKEAGVEHKLIKNGHVCTYTKQHMVQKDTLL